MLKVKQTKYKIHKNICRLIKSNLNIQSIFNELVTKKILLFLSKESYYLFTFLNYLHIISAFYLEQVFVYNFHAAAGADGFLSHGMR